MYSCTRTRTQATHIVLQNSDYFRKYFRASVGPMYSTVCVYNLVVYSACTAVHV